MLLKCSHPNSTHGANAVVFCCLICCVWTRIWYELFLLLWGTIMFLLSEFTKVACCGSSCLTPLSWGEQLFSLRSRPTPRFTSSIVWARPLCCSLTLGACWVRDGVYIETGSAVNTMSRNAGVWWSWLIHQLRGTFQTDKGWIEGILEASNFVSHSSGKCLSKEDLRVIRCDCPFMVCDLYPAGVQKLMRAFFFRLTPGKQLNNNAERTLNNVLWLSPFLFWDVMA